MSVIKNNLTSIQDSIIQHAEKNHKNAENITLLAVSKTKPNALIQEAYAAGQRAFGENYLQEAVDKIKSLKVLNEIEWHFIGPIQSNKTKPIAQHFDWVQSVDRLKIAKRLNDQRLDTMKLSDNTTPMLPLNVCIQVNISEETSKSGLSTADISELASFIEQAQGLVLRGLMAIPQKNAPAETYINMQQLFNTLQKQYATVDTLSMGMSNDMAIAIASGSTMVRIGTAIFGAREAKA